ncbi:hypothetical protein BCR33DRAFT_338389 [Rhizoclosmatium globosum]|uniref:BZIP domain-containing protein n=1 Tax=Rhizoclosmatium globosum TaxID=329046 RepID=A0A1Y2C3V8_9FUNG|nr:hypothetical protein BCR33DRAFT_338389 [Rhizoclosmatium globosum]|eukprot:ORY41718.1 hypothetical protein BCR33DRAFT_338389 [Rhizoclosmatium globosum]
MTNSIISISLILCSKKSKEIVKRRMDEELPPSKRPRRTTASANSATGTNDEDDGSSGSEAGSTPAPNATSIVTEVKPAKGKPGRKRIEVVDPNNKRIAQNRVAQRNYRERQVCCGFCGCWPFGYLKVVFRSNMSRTLKRKC